MKTVVKNLFIKIFPVIDILISPLTVLASLTMLFIRRAGIHRMKVSRAIFNFVGVYPIRDHYYEPLFNPSRLQQPMDKPRYLPGIDMNEAEQLDLVRRFDFSPELSESFKNSKGEDSLSFYYENPAFTYGDAEYLYSIIRLMKPKKIVEVGSGYSTLMAVAAVDMNKREDGQYICQHLCIEPYEMPWLESVGVEVLRKRVEEIPLEFFKQLEPGDILFIDSSHMIRPQGDVLYEFLELLPSLPSGVLIHIHDIFTPFDYPEDWVKNHGRLWNEQYLLEAFLSFNRDFRVIGALNWLKNYHPEDTGRAFPGLRAHPASIPGSFWIVKN